jgi:hypothetical protein
MKQRLRDDLGHFLYIDIDTYNEDQEYNREDVINGYIQPKYSDIIDQLLSKSYSLNQSTYREGM